MQISGGGGMQISGRYAMPTSASIASTKRQRKGLIGGVDQGQDRIGLYRPDAPEAGWLRMLREQAGQARASIRRWEARLV